MAVVNIFLSHSLLIIIVFICMFDDQCRIDIGLAGLSSLEGSLGFGSFHGRESLCQG